VIGERTLLIAAVTAVVSLAVAAGAAADEYQYKPDPADQATAKLGVLGRADIDPPFQRMTIPGLSSTDTNCPDFRPRRSDLVITGEAESAFGEKGVSAIYTVTDVLQTSEMMETAWRRELLAPGAADCGRFIVARGLRGSARVVSFKRLAFPRRGSHTLAYRVRLRSQNGQELLGDEIHFASGRTISVAVEIFASTPVTPKVLLDTDVKLVTGLATRMGLTRARA
jgi:hypothetical protein